MQTERCMIRQIKYLLLSFLFLLSNSCCKESAEPLVVARVTSSPEVEQELLGLVNEHRASLGYQTLAFSKVAYEYAGAHTEYMIAMGSISHDNFSARASDISAEVSAEYVAENVASDYPNAQQAMDGWLKSSTHRKTIEGNFTHTAISVKKDPSGVYYYTQLFFRKSP
jgi:uncharacterized protein YkwD